MEHRSAITLTLASSLPLLALPAPAGAAEAGAGAAELSAVTVTTPTRTERSAARSPASVEVIGGEELERSGATMLDEALREHSSVFIGADGTSASIRGAALQDTVFLIDGRRIRGASGVGYEVNRLPVSQVERVEIIKGPGSLMYGSDALGGVINIVTHAPQPGLQGSVSLQTGTQLDDDGDRHNLGLRLSGGGERTQFSLFADVLDRDAYTEEAVAEPSETPGDIQPAYRFEAGHREAAEVYNVGATLSHWLTDQLNLRLSGGVMDETRERDFVPDQAKDPLNGITGFPARRVEENDRLDLSASAEWLATEAWRLRYRAYYSEYHKERSNTVRPWADFGYASAAASEFGPREVTLADRTQELTGFWTPGPAHTLQLGLGHRNRRYQDHEPAGEPSYDQWVAGAFAQHEWQAAERLELVYGARYDDASAGVDETSLKGGAVLRLAPQARLKARYAEGFKVPEPRTYKTDTLDPRGRLTLGADVVDRDVGKEAFALEPERSRTYELGLSGELQALAAGPSRYALTAFRSTFDDRIEKQAVKDSSGKLQYITWRNVEDARVDGVEASLTQPLASAWTLALEATWLDAVNRETDQQLTYSPEHTALAALSWRPGPQWSARLRARRVGERYEDAQNTVKQAAYTLVGLDVRLASRRWEGVTWHAGVDNLLDEENDTSLYADPGRFARIGARYQF